MKKSIKIVMGALCAVAILSAAGVARADVSLPCAYDGYVAMGGMVFNASNSYLLPGNPASEPTSGMETFGYAFLKFAAAELPATPVSQALLTLDVVAMQDGMSWPVAGTSQLGAYAVSADVQGITSASAGAFVDEIAAQAADALDVSAAGLISLDVTSIVNGWIASGVNTGLVLCTPGGLMPRLHASESLDGSAPAIAIVPEPCSLALLALGAAAPLARRRRRQ